MLIDVSIAMHRGIRSVCIMPAFCFYISAPLQKNELCKVAPWEGIGIAHLIKELLEINAALLGAPAHTDTHTDTHTHTRIPVGVCAGCEYLCASVCVCAQVSLGVRLRGCASSIPSLCMHMSSSFLSASQPALPLIGGARWLTQHHTLGDSLSAG